MSIFIIAEIGVNHNGLLDQAKRLIDEAKAAGVDAVKFQTFKADEIVSKQAKKAEYQVKNTQTTESQWNMLKKLELSENDHLDLISFCKEINIEFMSSPFDLNSVELLKKLNVKRIKIPSGEITNAPLLLKAAQTGLPLIVSTGIANIGEIETALGVIAFGYLNNREDPSKKSFELAYSSEKGQKLLRDKVILLHCTTEYPAPFEEVNLRAMDTLKNAFGLQVGYSDHTEGIAIPIAAVARGAVVIEKHFTLDKKLPGPDHKASIEPKELKKMVTSIREIEKALGNFLKTPSLSEIKNKEVVRKSLFANRDIDSEEKFSEENIALKRPGDGIQPMFYWDLLGKKAGKSYKKDDQLTN
jgi:N-acetylneuraminate synthase